MASLAERITTTDEPPKSDDWADDNGQMDGSTAISGGSTMTEPEYTVEVKLIDTNSPLYSVKTFEELGLSVASRQHQKLSDLFIDLKPY